MNHWQTASDAGIIGGVVSTESPVLFATDTMPRKTPSKGWPLAIRQDVHQLTTDAATERGINPSYLVETILVQWLNANILRQPVSGTEFPRGSKLAYHVGRLAAFQLRIYAGISFDPYLFETVSYLSELRKQLKKDQHYTDEAKELFKNKQLLFTQGDLSVQSYPWFFVSFYSRTPGFLGADPPSPAQLPPDGTARLLTDDSKTAVIKRRGTTPWFLVIGEDVRTAVKFAASQLAYTVTGLVETILIDWLNRNQLADHTEARAAVPTESRQSYTAGQLARLELDQFGEVSLDGYLRDAGASLGSLKPRLRKAKQLTRATETLFREVRLTDFVIPPARRFWFFAGFCGLSFDFLAAKHSRGEIPGN